MSLEVKRGTVVLVDYNKNWAIEFEKEKKLIHSIFEGKNLDLQHIGSTSIPNLVAKPLIDIALKVKDLAILENEYNLLLQNGYVERVGRLQGKQRVFAKEKDYIVTHHLHIIEQGEIDWGLKIKFRDALLNNIKLIREYSELKKELFSKYEFQRLKYTEGKAEFIKRVLL